MKKKLMFAVALAPSILIKADLGTNLKNFTVSLTTLKNHITKLPAKSEPTPPPPPPLVDPGKTKKPAIDVTFKDLSDTLNSNPDELIKLIQNQPKLLELKNQNTGDTLLHEASFNGPERVINAIIALKPKLINAQNNAGRTPLMLAIFSEDAGNVQAVLKANPDRSLKNNEGKTAQDLAAETGEKDIQQLFGIKKEVKAKNINAFMQQEKEQLRTAINQFKGMLNLIGTEKNKENLEKQLTQINKDYTSLVEKAENFIRQIVAILNSNPKAITQEDWNTLDKDIFENINTIANNNYSIFQNARINVQDILGQSEAGELGNFENIVTNIITYLNIIKSRKENAVNDPRIAGFINPEEID